MESRTSSTWPSPTWVKLSALNPTMPTPTAPGEIADRYMGEYDLAISDYDAALLIDPDHGPAHRGRGAAWRSKGQLELAIADYDAAVGINPEDPFAYRFRGDAHLAHGDYVEGVVRLRCRAGPKTG